MPRSPCWGNIPVCILETCSLVWFRSIETHRRLHRRSKIQTVIISTSRSAPFFIQWRSSRWRHLLYINVPARSSLVLVTKDSFVSIFANLKNNDVAHVEFKARKKSFKKGADFLSISIEIIPTQLAYKIMQANSSGLEFITTISKFRKRKRISSSLGYVLLKT